MGGNMKANVDPNLDIADPIVIGSFAEAIAKKAEVDKKNVAVTLSKVSGRRLLATDVISIDYTIILDDVPDVPDVRERLAKVTNQEVAQDIAQELTANGVTASIEVIEFSEPEVEFVLKTTTTPLDFDWEDDFAVLVFQPGKFVFALVLSLTLRPVVQ